MISVNAPSLILLALALGAQIYLRSFCAKHIKKIFYSCVLLVFAYAGYLSFVQYWAFSRDPFSKFLLPPYAPWSYFIGYVGTRLWAPHLMALAAAVIIPYLANILNRRFEERFFEKEEFPIMGLGIFLSGYPGFLFYIPLVLLMGVLFSIFYQVKGKGRAPLYFVWLPAAIIVIVILSQMPQDILRPFTL